MRQPRGRRGTHSAGAGQLASPPPPNRHPGDLPAPPGQWGTLGKPAEDHQCGVHCSCTRHKWPACASGRVGCQFAALSPQIAPALGMSPVPPQAALPCSPLQAAWHGGITPSPGAAWPTCTCHAIPGVWSCCPQGTASLSLGWWDTVSRVVACHPQNNITLSPERSETGQKSLTTPVGDNGMASGPTP